jgi:hypothetical protein
VEGSSVAWADIGYLKNRIDDFYRRAPTRSHGHRPAQRVRTARIVAEAAPEQRKPRRALHTVKTVQGLKSSKVQE